MPSKTGNPRYDIAGDNYTQAQDCVDNLRRNIKGSKDPKERRQYQELIDWYRTKYRHLGVR